MALISVPFEQPKYWMKLDCREGKGVRKSGIFRIKKDMGLRDGTVGRLPVLHVADLGLNPCIFELTRNDP